MEQALRVRAVQTRRSRQPIPFQKLSWRKSPLTKAFVESSMYGMPPPTMTTPPTMPTDDVAPQYNWRPCEMNPALVIRKILVLFEYHRHDEVAHIIRAITDQTLKAIATELPIALFIDGVPRTLPIIDAVYTRVFLSAGVQRFPFNLMQPESVIMQLIRLFAHSDEPSAGQHNAKWTTSDVAACKNVLRIIAQVDPKLPKMLKRRKRALDKALEGLGMHGMVITPDQNLLNLHDALKVEFTNAIRNYRDVLEKLGDLELTKAKMKTRSIGKGTPPVEASHQRLLNLTHGEITERLTKNKIVWTTVEPVLYGSKLPALLNTLKERIETDKEAIYQFSQMRKEAGHLSHNTIVAPILMQYARGFDRILLLLCEVCDDSVSGYHSDSDSGGLNSGSRNTYHSIGLSNGSRGSSENLRTMGSNDSGRGNSLEGSTSKRDAVVGYSGPLGSSSNSSKGIPSVAESSTDSHYSAELGTLKHQVHGLRLELVKSKEVIVKLQQKEHAMIER
ncbi:PREDICTED: uncharacterized protein LOC106816238 isoform X2 [Priapulus caudatus]|uniref:Uncharacterized protein LOC106816238 isoform X2 n=1 Tax=Priapulus caudatus TaxID=37621 RepID=A0ABM1EVT1_PRICU|nr:PREDICTED: uncharacterized protein LOC106816238 isoform X2 [Priapulus caudatus]